MALIELLASLARVFQREELNHDQEQFSLHSGPAATRCRRPVSFKLGSTCGAAPPFMQEKIDGNV